MKRIYKKPVVIIEDFSLQTSIAAGCKFKTDLPTEGQCGYPTRNGVVFVSTITGCDYHTPDTNDSLCYHVPNEDYDIFNS